jgi:hypothetical protein
VRLDSENAEKINHVFLIPYKEIFDWSLCIEYAAQLINENKKVSILDFTYLNRNLMPSIARSLLGYRKINPFVIQNLISRGATYQRLISKRLGFFKRIYRDSDGNLDLSRDLAWCAYPSLVDKMRSNQILVGQNFRIIRSEISNVCQTFVFAQRIMKKFPDRGTIFYTPNGRYARNLAFVFKLRKAGYEVKILETHRRGAYQIWDNAQSVRELELKIESEWANSDSHTRGGLAKNYLLKRTTLSEGDNAEWKSGMSPSKTLALNPNYKYCIFYSTSQIEFAHGYDSIPKDEFQTQQEALYHLADYLKDTDWRLILRRHPNPIGASEDDTEKNHWKFLEKFPNVEIINPESPINSYLLGKSANLIAHFNSSIGAEFISMECLPVISLGPTPWDTRDIFGKVRSQEQIMDYFSKPLEVPSSEIVLPWAYFFSSGGADFQHVTEMEVGIWELKGFRIHESFSEWSQRQVGFKKALIQRLSGVWALSK